MGVTQSKSKAIVQSVVNAGVEVMKRTMSETVTPVTSINQIDLSNCHNMVITNIKQRNYVSVDVSSMVSALSDTEIAQDIAKAMKAQAESETVGGLGWSTSKAESIMSTVTNLSTAVTEEVSNVASASVAQINSVGNCGTEGGNMVIDGVDQENIAEVSVKMVTESKSVTTAMQKLQEELEALGVSKAKGWDPTMMVFLIVAVVIFFLFGGVGFVAKTLVSVSFWMLACGVATCFFIYMVISSYTGTWPGKKPPTDWPMTTDEEIAAKREEEKRVSDRNSTIRKWGAILASISGVATVGFGYAFVKQSGPKTIKQNVAKKPI